MPGFGPTSFGHTGAGGRLGIADPDYQVGFGYVCSRMRIIGAHGDPRWQALIAAVRTSLERS
jgi:CubicO group peptidase (beta-lactamase class C family)